LRLTSLDKRKNKRTDRVFSPFLAAHQGVGLFRCLQLADACSRGPVERSSSSVVQGLSVA
jgi:hypothetical protein